MTGNAFTRVMTSHLVTEISENPIKIGTHLDSKFQWLPPKSHDHFGHSATSLHIQPSATCRSHVAMIYNGFFFPRNRGFWQKKKSPLQTLDSLNNHLISLPPLRMAKLLSIAVPMILNFLALPIQSNCSDTQADPEKSKLNSNYSLGSHDLMTAAADTAIKFTLYIEESVWVKWDGDKWAGSREIWGNQPSM